MNLPKVRLTGLFSPLLSYYTVDLALLGCRGVITNCVNEIGNHVEVGYTSQAANSIVTKTPLDDSSDQTPDKHTSTGPATAAQPHHPPWWPPELFTWRIVIQNCLYDTCRVCARAAFPCLPAVPFLISSSPQSNPRQKCPMKSPNPNSLFRTC